MRTRIALAALALITAARPAFADATFFIGTNTTPSNRLVRGGSVGVNLLIVGFEFEYAHTNEDVKAGAPSLNIGSGNFLIQTPFPIFRVQPYATAGAGVYGESLGSQDHLGLGLNTGGGANVSLVGPLRVRLDYRVFRLGSKALYSPTHRLYAGLNLRF